MKCTSINQVARSEFIMIIKTLYSLYSIFYCVLYKYVYILEIWIDVIVFIYVVVSYVNKGVGGHGFCHFDVIFDKFWLQLSQICFDTLSQIPVTTPYFNPIIRCFVDEKWLIRTFRKTLGSNKIHVRNRGRTS